MNQDGVIYKGLPPAVILPLREYSYENASKLVGIKLPKSGKYSDINPNFPIAQVGGDEFNIVRVTKDGNKMFYLPDISRTLLVMGYYPDLQDHQLFYIVGIEEQETQIIVYGQGISMLQKEATDEQK